MLSLLPTDQQVSARPNERQTSHASDWVRGVWPLLSFLAKRVGAALITFLIITAVLYAMTLITPADDRARPYLAPKYQYEDADAIRFYLDQAIEKYGLDDPFPIQYGRWLGDVLRGEWGYSAILGTDVFSLVSARSPATLELTVYALILYIPMGLLVGTLIAWKQGGVGDRAARVAAHVTVAIPPFILGLVLIMLIYVQLGWFDLSRIGYAESAVIREAGYWSPTGFITIDAILNFRFDVAWQAVRHLVLPVTTLSLLHLSTLILLTRTSVAEQLQQEYVLMARGMGVRDRRILFGYALRNAFLPALTHAVLTAAQLMTGVYVVEVIFNWHGVSELVTDSLGGIPDTPLAMGFSVYSVLVVLSITLILDIVQGLVDPRIRQGTIEP